jgi:hypothetical protein
MTRRIYPDEDVKRFRLKLNEFRKKEVDVVHVLRLVPPEEIKAQEEAKKKITILRVSPKTRERNAERNIGEDLINYGFTKSKDW